MLPDWPCILLNLLTGAGIALWFVRYENRRFRHWRAIEREQMRQWSLREAEQYHRWRILLDLDPDAQQGDDPHAP